MGLKIIGNQLKLKKYILFSDAARGGCSERARASSRSSIPEAHPPSMAGCRWQWAWLTITVMVVYLYSIFRGVWKSHWARNLLRWRRPRLENWGDSNHDDWGNYHELIKIMFNATTAAEGWLWWSWWFAMIKVATMREMIMIIMVILLWLSQW